MSSHITIIGYGGNSYLIIDTLKSSGYNVVNYIDKTSKLFNPFNLEYLGSETDILLESVKLGKLISTIGNNFIRQYTQNYFVNKGFNFINCIHQHSSISSSCLFGIGNFVSARSVINPFSSIGNGVICNTGSIVEHESLIDDFVHIGPGAIICGNVSIGSCTFIGAGAVIKEGLIIGKNVIVGAGSVVISDIPDNCTVVGVPARVI